MDEFIQTVILGAGSGAVDALLAMGIVLIYRTTGVLNFAQATTGTLASFVVYSVALDHPLWVAIVAGLAAGSALGVGTDRVVSAIKTKNHALTSAVATLAVAILLQQAIRIGWGSTAGNFPMPFGISSWQVGSITVPYVTAASLITSAALVTAIGAFLQWTRVGTMLRAVADNKTAARLNGGNIGLLVGGVWAMSGALAATAGFFAAQVQSFDGSLLDVVFLGALLAAVLGGLRSLVGAFVGAIALEVVRSLFSLYAPDTVNAYGDTFLLVLLILFLVIAPRRWLAPPGARIV